jgi:hypothetical protein
MVGVTPTTDRSWTRRRRVGMYVYVLQWYITIKNYGTPDSDRMERKLNSRDHWGAGFFLFKFFKEADWWSPTRGMSQIWLDVRQWSGRFWKTCLVLATTRNSLSKYGNMWLFFLKKWRRLFFFFPQKKSLCALCTGF